MFLPLVQMEETAGERHYHEDIIDKRAEELQRHMEALEVCVHVCVHVY